MYVFLFLFLDIYLLDREAALATTFTSMMDVGIKHTCL